MMDLNTNKRYMQAKEEHQAGTCTSVSHIKSHKNQHTHKAIWSGVGPNFLINPFLWSKERSYALFDASKRSSNVSLGKLGVENELNQSTGE